MNSTVVTFPGVADPAERRSLTLPEHEIVELSGGYLRPADQLRALHERGYVRAWRRGDSGKVVLEREHVSAVNRGQFAPPMAGPDTRQRAKPDRAAFKKQFGRQ